MPRSSSRYKLIWFLTIAANSGDSDVLHPILEGGYKASYHLEKGGAERNTGIGKAALARWTFKEVIGEDVSRLMGINDLVWA